MSQNSSGLTTQTLLLIAISILFFMVIMGGVLAQVFGLIDIISYANDVPVIGEVFPETEEDNQDEEDDEDKNSDDEDKITITKEEKEKLDDLESKKEDLSIREEKLEEKEKQLEEKVKELEKSKVEVENREKELTLLKDENERLETLANTYKEMRAGDAAEILEELAKDDSDLAYQQLHIDILRELPTDHKADILTEMDPDRAKEITQQLSSH
ncbi:MotE family protein [Natranaerobius trueperi]|uniref:Magnesium transporter MgtE intracellular domain-containing protein n=1 Tax=Natranaerobius trueperi TaxID=759412 RepID=A0A226C1B5_9FIRM|nr:hypothetical protein [Natranaerobius trueperi]OWZ84229.1 hypothetical protein CDO51_04010 [Natranaerobius trueperi]